MSEARLQAIAHEQFLLAVEAETLRAHLPQRWPRHLAVSLLSPPGALWHKGAELGLAEPACQELSAALAAIRMDLEVQENGTCTILAVDGRPLGEQS